VRQRDERPTGQLQKVNGNCGARATGCAETESTVHTHAHTHTGLFRLILAVGASLRNGPCHREHHFGLLTEHTHTCPPHLFHENGANLCQGPCHREHHFGLLAEHTHIHVRTYTTKTVPFFAKGFATESTTFYCSHNHTHPRPHLFHGDSAKLCQWPLPQRAPLCPFCIITHIHVRTCSTTTVPIFAKGPATESTTLVCWSTWPTWARVEGRKCAEVYRQKICMFSCYLSNLSRAHDLCVFELSFVQ
jgi:hypothetical protein